MDIINQREQDKKVFECTSVSRVWAGGERGQKCEEKRKNRIEWNRL